MSYNTTLDKQLASRIAEGIGYGLHFPMRLQTYTLRKQNRGNKHPSEFPSYRLDGSALSTVSGKVTALIKPEILDRHVPSIASFRDEQPITQLKLTLDGISMLADEIGLSPQYGGYVIDHQTKTGARITGCLRPSGIGRPDVYSLEIYSDMSQIALY